MNCNAGDFVNQLLETMCAQGDKDNLQEFLFNNIHKTFSTCSSCGYNGEMLAQTSVFMLNVVPNTPGATLEAQVTNNLNPTEICPQCNQGMCNVSISFETLPRFLMLNTGAYYSQSQITPTLMIQNKFTCERHIYDLIGCNTVTANTSHQAIIRSLPGRWKLAVEDDEADLPSWEHALKRMTFGKATMFVFERSDVRRERPITKSSSEAEIQ